MADFNSLVADVMTITNRADLIAETQLAVKSATLQAHRQDFFFKDLKEYAIQYDTKDFLQVIGYRTLFPQYRSLSYLRKFDPTDSITAAAAQNGKFFEIISPQEVLDSYGYNRPDVCYVAGSVIQIRSSTAIQYSLIGIYESPIVTNAETYNSWIALDFPYAIVYAAASQIMGSILKNSAGYNINNTLATIEYEELRKTNILAGGS